MRILVVIACAAALLGLGACGEKSQQMEKRSDGAPASKGTGSQFVAQGWKPGDETSWNEQMRSRAQYGQNEYSRNSSK